MRIGVNARTFSVQEPGGVVQSAVRLTTELIENTDHEIVLLESESLRDRFDVTVRSDWWRNSQVWGLVWERTVVPRIAADLELDVLYCPDGNAPPYETSVPVVMCIHDVNAQKGMSGGIHGVYRRLTVPSATRHCDAVVTVSKFSLTEIEWHPPIESRSIHVIYNGIDDFYLSPNGSESLDLPEDYILYVGALNPRKNVRRFIEAFDDIRDEIPHKLVLIGPQNKSIFKNMEIDHLSREIVTPGFVPRKQLKYAYEQADVFVYPSLYEGFGLPPLEAMACGTPVLASDIDCFAEILADSAMLVDPCNTDAIGDGMMRLIRSEEAAEKLRQRGRRRVKEFTWAKTRERLLNVLSRAADPPMTASAAVLPVLPSRPEQRDSSTGTKPPEAEPPTYD